MKRFKVKRRCKTREQRNQSKMFLALAIVSWTIIMAVIIAYLTTLTAEGTSDPVVAEPPIETRKTARDEVEDAPAAEAAFDPVRDDIPMDAEHQRLLYKTFATSAATVGTVQAICRCRSVFIKTGWTNTA